MNGRQRLQQVTTPENRISAKAALRFSGLTSAQSYQLFEDPWILLPVKVPRQRRPERRFGRIRPPEEGHAGPEFHVIGRAEDRMRRAAGNRVHRRCAGPQAFAQYRVLQIGPRLVEGTDRVALRYGTEPKAGDLRKDEPHPVAALEARRQLLQRLVIASRCASTNRARSKGSSMPA